MGKKTSKNVVPTSSEKLQRSKAQCCKQTDHNVCCKMAERVHFATKKKKKERSSGEVMCSHVNSFESVYTVFMSKHIIVHNVYITISSQLKHKSV